MVLELAEMAVSGMAAGRWAGCGVNSALSKADGRSRRRCI